MKNTFPSVDPVDQNLYINLRLLILILQLIGGIGVFFLILEQISHQLKCLKKVNSNPSIEENETIKMMSVKTIAYSLILAIPGMLILSPLFIFLPLSVAGFSLMLLYGQIFGLKKGY